jgi:hypothetical protein
MSRALLILSAPVLVRGLTTLTFGFVFSASAEVMRKVLTQVMIDTSGLDGVAQRFYGMHIESLKATSFMYHPLYLFLVLLFLLFACLNILLRCNYYYYYCNIFNHFPLLLNAG